jgi:ribosomal protein S18 acetylase RimI-like enzyme
MEPSFTSFSGTRPEAQGKGFGSQLLRRELAHADEQLLPVYLEVRFAGVAR